MRATERRKVSEARTRIKVGDRAGAVEILDEVLSVASHHYESPDQLLLPIFLAVRFRCARLAVDAMPVRDCLTRRTRQWPSGGGRGSPAPAATACVNCPVGLSFSVRLPSFRPPPSTLAPEVLAPSQRRAKRARALIGLGPDDPISLDPLRVAASSTPDDAGLDYTP